MIKQTKHNPLLKAVTILTDIIEDIVEYGPGVNVEFVKQRLNWAKKFTIEHIKGTGQLLDRKYEKDEDEKGEVKK